MGGDPASFTDMTVPTVRPPLEWRTIDEIADGVPLWIGDEQVSELTDLIEQQMRDADAIRQKAINDLMREIGECDLNIKHYQDRRHEAEEMLAQLQPQTEPKRRPGRPPGSGKKAEAKQ